MRATAPLAVVGLLTAAAVAHADALISGDGADDARRACKRVTEPARMSSSIGPAVVGAGIVFDEHLVTDAARDQDYNGGGEITPAAGAVPLGGSSIARLAPATYLKTRPTPFEGRSFPRERDSMHSSTLVF